MKPVWSHESLDQLRLVGDSLADEVVKAIYETENIQGVNRLLRQLFTNSDFRQVDLPDVVTHYFKESSQLPSWFDPDRFERAQTVFWEHGVHMTTMLLCASLPTSYACKKGAHVLRQSYRLSHNPHRRVVETAQMVIDAMEPDCLLQKGRGMVTIQKVRLLHAATRYLLTADGTWDTPYYGVPINQEDMLGTMLVFSYIIVDGLPRLGVFITKEREEDYLYAWRVIGYLLGIPTDLMPANMTEAAYLSDLILERQAAPSEDGQVLTSALIDMFRQHDPVSKYTGISEAMMHYLMRPHIVATLGVKETALQKWLQPLFRAMTAIDNLEKRIPIAQKASQQLMHSMLNLAVDQHLKEQRVSFSLPDHLTKSWKIDDLPEYP